MLRFFNFYFDKYIHTYKMSTDKIRDLFKVKLYAIRSETKKKKEREKREKREREREKKEKERQKKKERDRL